MTESSEGLAVLNYLAVMSRWKWLVIGVTAVCLGAGFAYLMVSTPLYRATARLLYVQPVTINDPLVQGSYSQAYQQADIGTISAMVTSAQVAGDARKALGASGTPPDFSIEVSQPVDSLGNSSATVVGIDAVSPSPQTAAAAANATAQAFVDWRRDSKGTQVKDALTAIEAALESYTTPAARETAEYLQLKQSRQALELQLESLSSDFTIIGAASVPEAPFSPRRMHTLALAGSMGFVLGVVLAFLFEQLDTRVRDERQMTELLRMSALGHLPPLPRRVQEEAGVQMLSNPAGPMAEAIRVLRGNLSFTGVDGDVRSVLITSSVRSEGKSVTASNLAVSLALAGQRVVLVDADFRRPRIHTYLRVRNAVGLSSVLARRVELAEAIIPVSLGRVEGDAEQAAPEALVRDAASGRVISVPALSRDGEALRRSSLASSPEVADSEGEILLRVLPSGPLPPNPGEMAASQRFGEVVRQLADAADFVIIDTPPLLEVGDAAAMASKADGVVFVANMNRVRWPMLERAHAQLEKFPCRKLGLVVVAAKNAHRAAYGYDYRYRTAQRGASTRGTRA